MGSPRRRVRVIAHRGASAACPENTLAALRRAIELGADWVEIDCQATRDGEVVVLHDETLDRTTSGRGPLRERTLAEVRALDAGAWFGAAHAGERVPTLAEAIDVLRGHAGLNLEIKGDDEPGALEIACVGLLASRGFLDDTVFSSFSVRRMRRLRQVAPHARVAVLLDVDLGWPQALALAEELRAEAVHPERSLITAEAVAEAHRRGLEVRPWSVNRETEMGRLVDLGVDGIFTDHPDRLVALLRSRGA